MFFTGGEKPLKSERVFESPIQSFAKEHFFDITDRKVFDTNVHREYLSKKILFDINLEERRGKLRNLLENDENTLTEEHLSKIETLGTRIKNLKEQALRIRKQKEIERHQIADKCKTQQIRINDDKSRYMQNKYHQEAIVEDWEKLKEIKDRLKREEYCTNKFWESMDSDFVSDICKKDKQRFQKQKEMKHDFLEQIAVREKQRQAEKEEIIENRKRDVELAKIVDQQLADEAVAEHNANVAKQVNYRNILDNHIRNNKAIKEKHQSNENAYELLAKDENLQELRQKDFSSQKKVKDNLLTLKNFIQYQDCLKLQKQEEDVKLGEIVQNKQNELHKYRLQMEKDRVKRFKKLIAEIKDAQKLQLVEAKKKTELEKEAKIEERIFANKIYEEGIKSDKLKLEKIRKKNEVHFEQLKKQLDFNENLRNIRKAEHERERNSMAMAENNYLKTLDDIRSKERMMFLHSWRTQN